MLRILILSFAILFSQYASMAQTSRSYMEKEIVTQSAYGPISEVPMHSGTWVEWDANGNHIIMMDGSKWTRTNSNDGLLHYKYAGTSGQLPPYTRLIEAVFTTDYLKMNIRYSFGPAGMPVLMSGKYVLLGDGKQLAIDWVNQPDDE